MATNNILYDKTISVILRCTYIASPPDKSLPNLELVSDRFRPLVIHCPLTGIKPDIRFKTGFVNNPDKAGHDTTETWSELQIYGSTWLGSNNLYKYNRCEVILAYGNPRLVINDITSMALLPYMTSSKTKSFTGSIMQIYTPTPNPNGYTVFRMLPGGDTKRIYEGSHEIRSTSDSGWEATTVVDKKMTSEGLQVMTFEQTIKHYCNLAGLAPPEIDVDPNHPIWEETETWPLTDTGEAFKSRESLFYHMLWKLNSWQASVKKKHKLPDSDNIIFINTGTTLSVQSIAKTTKVRAYRLKAITAVEWDGSVARVIAPWDFMVFPGMVIEIPMHYYKGFLPRMGAVVGDVLSLAEDFVDYTRTINNADIYKIIDMNCSFHTNDDTNSMSLQCVRVEYTPQTISPALLQYMEEKLKEKAQAEVTDALQPKHAEATGAALDRMKADAGATVTMSVTVTNDVTPATADTVAALSAAERGKAQGNMTKGLAQAEAEGKQERLTPTILDNFLDQQAPALSSLSGIDFETAYYDRIPFRWLSSYINDAIIDKNSKFSKLDGTVLVGKTRLYWVHDWSSRMYVWWAIAMLLTRKKAKTDKSYYQGGALPEVLSPVKHKFCVPDLSSIETNGNWDGVDFCSMSNKDNVSTYLGALRDFLRDNLESWYMYEGAEYLVGSSVDADVQAWQAFLASRIG
jgi:hypothetical protein